MPSKRSNDGIAGDNIRPGTQKADTIEDESCIVEIAGEAVGVDEGVEGDNVRVEGERGHDGEEEVVG